MRRIGNIENGQSRIYMLWVDAREDKFFWAIIGHDEEPDEAAWQEIPEYLYLTLHDFQDLFLTSILEKVML